jgi:hypothetical protein
MRSIVAAGVLLSVVGCGDRPAAVPAAPPSGPVELTPVTVAGFDAAVADRKGKVIYVDVWFLG